MTTTGQEKTKLKYKLHWHVYFVHFPISFFIGSFSLVLIHIVNLSDCFETAGFIALAAGTAVMVPTTITGWVTWKRRYKGLKSQLFMTKIRISFAMIGISLAMVIFRILYYGLNLNVTQNVWHAIFFSGTTLLLMGAVTEGYYGGRLNHR